MGRVLAVDPGDRRIGLAVSDPTGLVARPLKVIEHRSRQADARAVVEQAQALGAGRIIVGLPLDAEGHVGSQARKALRLTEEISRQTELPVESRDESGTTKRAIEIGGDDEHVDSRAAAVLLQEYLDAQSKE